MTVYVSAFDNVCGQLINRVRYSLNESPSAEFFKIEETSGRICLSKSVDFERISRHQLTVYAHNTAGKSKALINVILEDVNDNVPVFNPISYNLTLFDEVPSVTLVLTVHAEDADSGQLGKIQYILENDVDKLFRVDPSTGNLYTNRPSENFVKNSYHVIVSAKDSGGLTSTKPAQIFVDMHPKNQDCPRFTQFIYEFNVSEDILPNIVIGTVEATGSSDIRYYIHDKEARNDFRIDERLGKISVTHDLDADKRDFILLNLEARSYSGCSGFAQAKILIRDLNDNSPVFDFTNVETTLLEDFPIHEPFFAVQATDRDKHENGKVTYELISSEPPCPVMIRPLTGQLLLAASLDYEKVQKYRLRIRAIDQGLPPRMNETIVTILVQDVNDNAPELVNAPAFHNIEVSENAPLMSEVIQLKATDKDSGENGIVQFRIVEDNVPEFEIEPTSGQIFVKQNLDRETTPEYTFTVMAYDLGMPQLYANASIHIRVLDVNDNTPNCSTITPITISEDMEPFEIVGLLNAYDPDSSENGTVIYRLQQTHEFFELKRSGELRLKKRIPTDALRRLYHLSVIAEDQGAKPRSTVCQVVVKYEESRSLVQIIEPLQRVLRIAPDIAKGTEIVHIEAMNANNWTIGDRNDISKYFVIQDGSLKTNSSIDPDSFQKPQPLTVKVFDSAGHSRHVTFMIRLNYKSSGDHSMQTVKLSEDTAIGTPILNFSGPKKANFEQYFTLNYSSGLFEIDESSGTIYLAGHLDYKNRSEHVLKIVNVNLHTKEENITTVIVEVERSNKRLPLFTSMSYRFSVSEDTPIGASIGRVEFEEVYDELSISFKLNDKTSTFNIDSDTGEIYVQKSLNYNSASAYLLAVEAQESASKEKLSRHCLVHIDIVDINNNIPMFISPSNITLSHSERVGDPFHYFFAMDQDSGKFGTVSYSILSGNEQDLFEMNSTTGGLSLKKRLKDSIRLTIRASDGDTIPKFSDQLFNIFIDYGSSSSLWKYFEKDHYAFTLNADTPIGSLVHNFKRLNEPMVTFVLLPETQGEFQMDNNNGLLKTATKLTNKDYKLIVYVHTFDGNSSDFTTIDIQVKNFHTKGPKIVASSCGNVTVRENLAKDNLMRIFAIVDDADEDFPITYHIEGGSDHDLFSINASTGVISCKELDRETKPEHFLIISVSDNSIPKKADVCTIRVKVKDENDNVPIIRAASDVLEINDYTHVGAVLMKFTASDLDEGDNGRIKFMLVDDKSHLLDLKPESGELIFARDLPFTEKEWIIVISAMDSGKGRVLSSEKRIRILYKRRHIQTNNGAPEFLRHKYVAFVQESLPRGQLVAHIQTTYGSTREAPLTYSIVGGNFDSAFEIDGNGRISTAQELDAEIESEYKLRVIATGSPLKTPETTVEVKVLNINDNPPSFPVVRTRKISETLRPGSLITTVMANDVDADTQLEYRLNPANDYFEIEHLTGTIYLTKPLDFEVEPRFTLGIQAFDGIHFANLNLTFDVQDANDNAPMLKSLIEITVSPLTRPNSQIGKIIATDPDQGRAGEVFYELLTGKNLIRVERTTGIVTLLNMPFESTTHFATIKASDSGTPPLSTISTILLKPASKSVDDSPKFEKSFYTFVVSENFALHQTFGVLSTVNRTNELDYQYMIHDFKSEKQFSINRFGELSLKSPLDRETSREYRFQVNLTSLSHEFEPRSATVLVQISDINDNSPKIDPETSMKEIRLEERMKKGTILGRLFATDPDNAENGRIKYSIIAGNEPSLIQVNSNTGVVQFEHWDDSMLFESIEEIVKKNVTFLIEDEGLPPNWISYNVPLIFDTSTWSGSAPMFPIPVYHRYVLESLPKNAIILQVQAANRWGRQSSNWKYSISNHDEIFGIRVKSGEIVLLSEFDYEKRMSYEFKVQVTDLAQRSAVVSVHIHVIGVDEFAPIFTKETFRFQVPISARVGQRVGTIRATDADA
uniref:Cadherin domain-containing protein n=1 Tax=Acrobeloides nanus TaxID=290746 RepID=A0A914CZ00_9BILA